MKGLIYMLLAFVGVLPYCVKCVPMMNIALPVVNEYRKTNSLPLLSWSKTLEGNAYQLLEGCPTKTTTPNSMLHFAHGETAFYLPKVVENAIIQWANQATTNRQLDWNDTKQVGCAINTCPNSTVVLGCVYAPSYM